MVSDGNAQTMESWCRVARLWRAIFAFLLRRGVLPRNAYLFSDGEGFAGPTSRDPQRDEWHYCVLDGAVLYAWVGESQALARNMFSLRRSHQKRNCAKLPACHMNRRWNETSRDISVGETSRNISVSDHLL